MNQALSTSDVTLRRYGIPEPYLTKIVRSRCHATEKVWIPQEGSAAFDRKMAGRKTVEPQGTKIHWDGARCPHVMGRFAFLNKDRTIEGHLFSQTDRVYQCGTCRFHFENA